MLVLLNPDRPDRVGDATGAVEVNVEADGRVLLPTDVRRRLGARTGDTLLIDVTGDGVLLWTREMAAAGLKELALRSVPPGISLTNELRFLRGNEAHSLERKTRTPPPQSKRGRG